MINQRKTLSLLVLGGLFCCAQSTNSAVATGYAASSAGEKRIYEILIDNKHAGQYQLTFSPTADGGTRVDSEASVAYKVLIFGYNYQYKGHEIWKGDQLVLLESDTNDNGKRISLRATKEADGVHVVNNGKPRVLSGDTITSSYWHLLDSVAAGTPRQYLEVDSGRVFKAQFKSLPDSSVTVGSGSETCRHYKVTGDDSCELWYDGAKRLVRQISTDDGHTTTVTLKSRS